jgi:hypothetical protein
MSAPRYDVSLSFSELHHARGACRARLDHVCARLNRNPNTPNARHLRDEREALIGVVNALDERLNEHFAKISAHFHKEQA